MTGHGVSLKVRTARYGFAHGPFSWLALAVILTGCATPTPQVMHGRSRPPGQYATLVTSITHGLSIDSIDGTPPTGAPMSRQEITPGHHTVKVRAVITEGGRPRATGPVSLSFVAR